MLHYEETAAHADSIFLGEAEGRMEEVIADFKNGKLKKVYNYLNDFPETNLIGTARRDILKTPLYTFPRRANGGFSACFARLPL